MTDLGITAFRVEESGAVTFTLRTGVKVTVESARELPAHVRREYIFSTEEFLRAIVPMVPGGIRHGVLYVRRAEIFCEAAR